MRKTVTTYRDQRRTIRSFYLAPVTGITLTILVPVIYFFVQLFKTNDMFCMENTAGVVTIFFGFLIEFSAMCYMAYQAHVIRREVSDDMRAHILRGL